MHRVVSERSRRRWRQWPEGASEGTHIVRTPFVENSEFPAMGKGSCTGRAAPGSVACLLLCSQVSGVLLRHDDTADHKEAIAYVKSAFTVHTRENERDSRLLRTPPPADLPVSVPGSVKCLNE